MEQFDLLLLKIKELIRVTRNNSGGGSNPDTSAIKTNTGNTNLILDNILVELRDDRFLTETIWYDKTDITKFYIRKTTLNQDSSSITISFLNIDGTDANPIISNLVSTVTNHNIEIVSTEYDVITGGNGYSIGDQVEELKLVDTSNNTVTSIFYNKTLGTTIVPVFSHLTLSGKYITPSHVELLTGTVTLPFNTYRSVSLMVMDGSCNITLDGITINNFPTNYSEVWGNGNALLNRSISITANANSRIVINTIK